MSSLQSQAPKVEQPIEGQKEGRSSLKDSLTTGHGYQQAKEQINHYESRKRKEETQQVEQLGHADREEQRKIESKKNSATTTTSSEPAKTQILLAEKAATQRIESLFKKTDGGEYSSLDASKNNALTKGSQQERAIQSEVNRSQDLQQIGSMASSSSAAKVEVESGAIKMGGLKQGGQNQDLVAASKDSQSKDFRSPDAVPKPQKQFYGGTSKVQAEHSEGGLKQSKPEYSMRGHESVEKPRQDISERQNGPQSDAPKQPKSQYGGSSGPRTKTSEETDKNFKPHQGKKDFREQPQEVKPGTPERSQPRPSPGLEPSRQIERSPEGPGGASKSKDPQVRPAPEPKLGNPEKSDQQKQHQVKPGTPERNQPRPEPTRHVERSPEGPGVVGKSKDPLVRSTPEPEAPNPEKPAQDKQQEQTPKPVDPRQRNIKPEVAKEQPGVRAQREEPLKKEQENPKKPTPNRQPEVKPEKDLVEVVRQKTLESQPVQKNKQAEPTPQKPVEMPSKVVAQIEPSGPKETVVTQEKTTQALVSNLAPLRKEPDIQVAQQIAVQQNIRQQAIIKPTEQIPVLTQNIQLKEPEQKLQSKVEKDQQKQSERENTNSLDPESRIQSKIIQNTTNQSAAVSTGTQDGMQLDQRDIVRGVRMLHLAQNAPELVITVRPLETEWVRAENASFGQASSYLAAGYGLQLINVALASDPTKIIYSFQQDFGRSEKKSLVIYGDFNSHTGLQSNLITDQQEEIAAGYSSIRAINAFSGTEAIRAAAGMSDMSSYLPYGDASGYMTVESGTVSLLAGALPNGTTLFSGSRYFEPQKYYTMCVSGLMRDMPCVSVYEG